MRQRRQSVFRIGGGAKSDHGEKTVYVYLLTYSILYKNTAYFEVGLNYVYAPTIYYWRGGNRPSSPGSTTLVGGP